MPPISYAHTPCRMYMAPAYPCLVTDLSALRDPYPAKNGPKRSPKFCRRSEFERIIEKSQIFFKFRVDFRKKVCKKGAKKGVLDGLGVFPLFYPILGHILGCGD